MKTALLGIDVGTSACKVAAFDLEGHVLAQAAESYPVLYPQPGWAEQDPQQWWEAVCRALRRLWESGAVAPGEVAGCLLYTSPSPRDLSTSRMPSSA